MSRLDIVDRGDHRPNVHSGDKRHRVNDFVAKLVGKSVLIFTGGSVWCSQERGVGPGACAAVMCPLHGDGGERIFTRAVGKRTDILSCEVDGIVLGVEKVVNITGELVSGTLKKICTFCVTVIVQLTAFWKGTSFVTTQVRDVLMPLSLSLNK